jgi:hypothetical protein
MTGATFRERFPAPWRVVRTEGGYEVRSGATTLVYIYVSAPAWANVVTANHHLLRRAEGLALAKAIAGLGRLPPSSGGPARVSHSDSGRRSPK